jgi:hypothetical protein
LESTTLSRATPLGVGAGGNIVQHVEADTNDPRLWDVENSRIINIQLLDARSFTVVTGLPPPSTPITAETYAEYGFPFFQVWRDEALGAGVAGNWGRIRGAAEITAMNARKGRHTSSSETESAAEETRWGLLENGAWGRLNSEGPNETSASTDTTGFSERKFDFPVVLLHVDGTTPKFKSVVRDASAHDGQADSRP